MARITLRCVVGASAAAVAAFVTVGAPALAKVPFQAIPPVIPRSASAMVPRSATSLRISWNGAKNRSITITNRQRSRKLASIINALPQEGAGICSEGFIEGPPTIRFRFLNARGVTVASASEVDSSAFVVAWCVPTLFSRPGQRTIRLEGGGFLLKQAEKILHRGLGDNHSDSW